MEQGTEAGKEMKIPEGWPTEEMIEAGVLEMLGRSFDKMIPVSESVIGIFKAMLAAAPTPPAQDGLKVEFTKDWCMKMAELEGDSEVGVGCLPTAQKDELVAVVINNNQPGWRHVIESRPYTTLPVGTKLYTRPQPDKLRQAAEEVLNIVHERNLYSEPLPRRFWDAFDSLRTALEQSG